MFHQFSVDLQRRIQDLELNCFINHPEVIQNLILRVLLKLMSTQGRLLKDIEHRVVGFNPQSSSDLIVAEVSYH